jgi:hypothetical protein
MPRVLHHLRQAANLIERVAAGACHGAADGERPAREIDRRLEHVVAVIRKLGERDDIAVAEARRAVRASKQRAGGRIAPGDAGLQQAVAERRHREPAEQQQRTQLEQLAPCRAAIDIYVHLAVPVASGSTINSTDEDKLIAR